MYGKMRAPFPTLKKINSMFKGVKIFDQMNLYFKQYMYTYNSNI